MKSTFLNLLIIIVLVTHCFAQNDNNKDIKIVEFCQLFNSAEYDEKTVTTSAVLYSPAEGQARVDGDSDEFFYQKKCNNRDYFAETDFSQTKNLTLLANESDKISDNNLPRLYFVTFTGKFSFSYTPQFGHLGWLRTQFLVDKIESIKLIKSKYNLPDYESDAPISGTSVSLQNTNTNFIFSLFSQNYIYQNLDNLLLTDSQIKFNGKSLDIKEILGILSNEKATVELQSNEIKLNKNEWKAEGTVTIRTEEKIVKQLNFINKFLLQKDNSWKLIESNIMEIQNEKL